MTISKFVSAAVLAFSVSLISACSANSAELTAQQATSDNYLKPGASVTYSHNLKSQLSVGETVDFKLVLGESYNQGQLDVRLSTEGDIGLFPTSTQASFDMTEEANHEMNVSFVANSNGRHYINVQALAFNPSGQSRPRIFSIPVQVGPITAQKPDPNMKIMESGEKIIEMEAEETFK